MENNILIIIRIRPIKTGTKLKILYMYLDIIEDEKVRSVHWKMENIYS